MTADEAIVDLQRRVADLEKRLGPRDRLMTVATCRTCGAEWFIEFDPAHRAEMPSTCPACLLKQYPMGTP